VQSCGDGCLDVYVGKGSDNIGLVLHIFEQTVHLPIDNGAAITSATLVEEKWDDYMQILLGGKKVWQGPNDSFLRRLPAPATLENQLGTRTRTSI